MSQSLWFTYGSHWYTWHHYTYVALNYITMASLHFCGSNFIMIHSDITTLMWLKLYHNSQWHSYTYVAWIISQWHLYISVASNYITLALLHFCGSNYITVTSLHFCGSNYIIVASLHLCGTELYYCDIALLYGLHYPLAHIHGLYIFYGSYYSPVACIPYVLAHSLKCILYWAALQISMVRLYLWVIYVGNVIYVIMIYGRSGDKTFDDSDNSMITRLLMTVIIVWLQYLWYGNIPWYDSDI